MIGFVIVTYQSARAIGGCLAALNAVAGASVVVVDNASTDDTAAMVAASGASLVLMERNLGFAAAANLGARASQERVLCFLNPDCLVTPDAVDTALGVLARHPRDCVVPSYATADFVLPGRQYGYTRWKLLADMMESGLWPRRLIGWVKRRPGYEDRSWCWPLGTCLFIARDRFLGLGGFDERYFLYMEDVEFGRTLCRSGGRVHQIDHVLSHGGAMGSCVSRRDRERLLTSGRQRYGRQAYGPGFHLLMKLARAL
ncbi:MAG: glycosyltransferase [Azospirillaceae bacterium]